MLKRFLGQRNADPTKLDREHGNAKSDVGATAVAAANKVDETENLLELAVSRARSSMKQEVADVVLPPESKVTGVKEQTFRSRTFHNAAYDAMPERYGDHDRSLTTVKLDTGGQVFIAAGKISSGNPYEVGHAAGGGMDLRQDYGVVYAYDGQQTITEYMPDGGSNTYEGEYGSPDALLPHLVSSLGEPVGSEVYAQS